MCNNHDRLEAICRSLLQMAAHERHSTDEEGASLLTDGIGSLDLTTDTEALVKPGADDSLLARGWLPIYDVSIPSARSSRTQIATLCMHIM